MTAATHRLLATLARSVGHESAANELRWMLESLNNPGEIAQLAAMVERRVNGEPLQYILGTQPFGTLDLLVRPPTLIPRPETEEWVTRLATLVPPQPHRNILDLCTGSGCIPILLADLWSKSSTTIALGIDKSHLAVSLAHDNAEYTGVRKHSTLDFIQADIFHTPRLEWLKPPNSNGFDLITANPPYIPRTEYDSLPIDVKDWEDPDALLGDPQNIPNSGSSTNEGLSFYHEISHIASSPGILAPRGTLTLEVGDGQADKVAAILKERKGAFANIEIWADSWGKRRTVCATRM